MFKETSNPYHFKYLITGITGPGITTVYLPPVPDEKEILFKKEQRFVRPEMPSFLEEAVREMLVKRAEKPKKGVSNINWVHPKHQDAINEWEDREFKRCEEGIWFWNNGVPTYLTPFHYWYLSAFQAYFGKPAYRETDKEICYFLEFCVEDPDSYGTAFNTIRRYGKSVIMGAWALKRTTSSFNHFAGMQGENDKKIKKFYDKFIKKPFFKLPYYHQPTYNTSSQQTEQIEFDLPSRHYRQGNKRQLSLESVIEYRESSEGAYDGDPLNTYLMEEPGKTKRVSIYNNEGDGRWDIIQPCLSDGLDIIGKAFLGTTVENLNISDKGGQAYMKLFYDSDYDQKQENGRTRSGLYACFLPGDCALKGYWDDHGHPLRKEAREALLRGRKSYKNNPSKLAGHIRKYPLTIREIFYVNPENCEFNADILQSRSEQIHSSPVPLTSKYILKWANNQRFTSLELQHNPSGWLQLSSIPPKDQLNKVGRKTIGGVEMYHPLNDKNVGIGMDPIDHGMTVDTRMMPTGEDVENVGKKSKPVVLAKIKYDILIDGLLTPEEFALRAQPGKMVNGVWTLDEKGRPYEYKTNRYFLMMDNRPYDPNILYERTLMICWWLGASLNVESQKPGVIRYFQEHNCRDFILNKYTPIETTANIRDRITEGTAASTPIIQDYTGLISTYVEYFGHTIPFIEVIEDLLRFNPRKTQEFDYTVGMGFTEMSTLIKPKVKEHKILELDKILPTADQYARY